MQDAFWGILIPFLGTSLGAGCVFFLKKSLSDGIQRALTGFADPGHGAGCRSGQAGVFPCSGGLLAGHPVFAAAGSPYSASAPE